MGRFSYHITSKMCSTVSSNSLETGAFWLVILPSSLCSLWNHSRCYHLLASGENVEYWGYGFGWTWKWCSCTLPTLICWNVSRVHIQPRGKLKYSLGFGCSSVVEGVPCKLQALRSVPSSSSSSRDSNSTHRGQPEPGVHAIFSPDRKGSRLWCLSDKIFMVANSEILWLWWQSQDKTVGRGLASLFYLIIFFILCLVNSLIG